MAPQGAPGNSSHYRPRMRNGPWIPGAHASPRVDPIARAAGPSGWLLNTASRSGHSALSG